MASAWHLAFGLPGYQEMLVLLVIGLLIFGRRLPEVGRAVGKTLTEFRKGMQSLKDQIDRDEDFREARSTVHDFRRAMDPHEAFAGDLDEIRDLGDPRKLLEDLTDETTASPGPETTRVPSPPDKGIFEEAAERGEKSSSPQG